MFQYTIMPGDNLYSIAAKFNTPVNAILAANPGLSPYNLIIGQAIMIPTSNYPQYPTYPVYPVFPVPYRPYPRHRMPGPRKPY